MMRLTKADLETEAGVQKLNQMLWGRCKAGKITQSEYAALAENRDVNLKRLIVEKNLTLAEARKVRSLIMDHHLAMKEAVDVAKDKMSLAIAKKEAMEAECRRVKRLPLKKGGQYLHSKKVSPDGDSVFHRRNAAPTESVRDEQGKGSLGREKGPSLKTSWSQRQQQQKSNSFSERRSFNRADREGGMTTNQSERRERLERNDRNNRFNRPNRPNNYQKRSDRGDRFENRRPVSETEQQAPVQNREDRFQPSRPSYAASNHQRSRFIPRQKPKYREEEKIEHQAFVTRSKEPGFAEDIERTYREEEEISAARQWRDWRDERNIQLQEQNAKLEPVPPGQDWYPGMGFRPSDDPPENPFAGKPLPSSVERAERSERRKPNASLIRPVDVLKEGAPLQREQRRESVASVDIQHADYEQLLREEKGTILRKDPMEKGVEQKQSFSHPGGGMSFRSSKNTFNRVRRFVPRKRGMSH